MHTIRPIRSPPPWLWPAAAWSVVAAGALGGVAWRDCLMLAAAAWLATLAFEGQMARRAPWQAWRAGVRCAGAGLLMLLVGTALVVAMLLAMAGQWLPGRPHPMVLALLALAAIGVGLAQSGRMAPQPLARLLAGAAALAAALWLDAQGTAAVPCVTGIVVGLFVTRFGWRLLRGAGACWRLDQDR